MDWNKAFGKVIGELDEEIAEDQKKLDKFMKMMDGVKDGDRGEVINIQFTSEEMDKILKYQDLAKKDTIQDAIMTAIEDSLVSINARCEV